jgi:hypothetical protein
MGMLSVPARTRYKQSIIFLYLVIFDLVNDLYLVQEMFYLSELISQFSAIRSIVRTKIDIHVLFLLKIVAVQQQSLANDVTY